MSEFHSVDVAFQDEQCLIESLKEMGYTPQVHEEAKNLYGFQGDQRNQKAHIILPRSQVGAASNDVGFLRKAKGDYEMIVSAYDKGATFTTAKVNQLKQMYAKKVILKQVKKSKYKIRSEQVQADGSIKIKVRLRS